MKFDEVALQEKPQKVLVYGPPKTGKTELVARLVEAGYNLIWFDVESGYQTIKTRIDKKYWPQIELIRIPDTRENAVGYTTVARAFTMKPISICIAHGAVSCVFCTKDKKPFDSINLAGLDTNTVVAIDSLTQISASLFNKATANVSDLVNGVEFKHYAALGQGLDALLTAIQQAPFHVAVISHQNNKENPDKSKVIVPAGGTQNFSDKVPKYFDHIVYTTLYNGKFKQASSAGFNVRIMAGSRSDLAMESGKCRLADLFKATPIVGAMSGDEAAKSAAAEAAKEAAKSIDAE